MNKVEFIGNLGKDPEQRTLDSGRLLSRITFATNERFVNAHGEQVVSTAWHQGTAFGEVAKICGVFKKGDFVKVTGQLKYHNYETDGGQKHKRAFILVREVEIVEKKVLAPVSE